ncbi:hypothetical protein [Glutamicibacter sp.]|jgi:hypothetical protein|uniref:hypothetical protein n=1 Tax=Glutamicibacter TaxID=1742989 RepID=UPI002B499266|nr:hypothetical protein [Glutamicibacter sp.]HJX80276.1 hypothetical protein [Glutamicibacter sp.]
MTEKLLKELIDEIKSLHSTIGIMQEDINCIRNGEYDKPSGASPAKSPSPNIRPAGAVNLETKVDW